MKFTFSLLYGILQLQAVALLYVVEGVVLFSADSHLSRRLVLRFPVQVVVLLLVVVATSKVDTAINTLGFAAKAIRCAGDFLNFF